MLGLLIADGDPESRRSFSQLFIDAGYNVTVTHSAADALYGILKHTAQVVLLSKEFDEMPAAEFIPLLKQCNRDLTIILVADELSLPLTRKTRREGIFYHALKPSSTGDVEEIRQVVECAFNSLQNRPCLISVTGGTAHYKPHSERTRQ